jgi:predicted cupin superfamily sugar epimerase
LPPFCNQRKWGLFLLEVNKAGIDRLRGKRGSLISQFVQPGTELLLFLLRGKTSFLLGLMVKFIFDFEEHVFVKSDQLIFFNYLSQGGLSLKQHMSGTKRQFTPDNPVFS